MSLLKFFCSGYVKIVNNVMTYTMMGKYTKPKKKTYIYIYIYIKLTFYSLLIMLKHDSPIIELGFVISSEFG